MSRQSLVQGGLSSQQPMSSFQPAAAAHSTPDVGVLLLGFSTILPDGMWITCRRRAGSRKIVGDDISLNPNI